MTGASRKIWILIYPHPSDARESQKDTPFLFFLFRRQSVSKGNFISNRENPNSNESFSFEFLNEIANEFSISPKFFMPDEGLK